ncbi:Hsp20/alpha crystallin family protein [Mucilaginibacter corticis]|uniref:Hsp20/alpha crystallin family protein n=1 Tax=Mucilaginibacter corticis TaxID=2597670 RepID=A0A556MM05_9SPHI|nr:Hsp20/alpha crystallin family protein [Mucilaginibacter corticis]TSJ40878.1 Hsp20/alpha crystallin family protein [Mucilaginibacter corticis]
MTLVKFGKDQKSIVNPFFNDVYSLLNDSFLNEKAATRTPAVNISESDNQFEVDLAIPGLSKEDIKINLDKNVLSVSADKKTETVDENKKFTKREYSFNSFSRSFTLPESADHSKIEADYTAGILKLTIAKKEEAKFQTREIAVK